MPLAGHLHPEAICQVGQATPRRFHRGAGSDWTTADNLRRVRGPLDSARGWLVLNRSALGELDSRRLASDQFRSVHSRDIGLAGEPRS